MESGIQHIFHSLSVWYTIVAMQNVFYSLELSQECVGTHSDYILPRPDGLSFGSNGILFFRIRNIWFLLIHTSLRPWFVQPFTCQRYSSPLKLKIWRKASHEKIGALHRHLTFCLYPPLRRAFLDSMQVSIFCSLKLYSQNFLS